MPTPMPSVARRSIALVVGATVASTLIAAVDALGHAVYPVPAGLDLANLQQLERHLQAQPVGALLCVAASWAVGAFAGGLSAALVAGSYPRLFAGLIGGLVLAATVVNLLTVPHPAWVIAVGVVGIGLATAAAGALAPRLAGR